MEIALDDAEVLGVVDGLHDEPREGFVILGVDGRGFEEFGVELLDGLLVGLCAHVWFRSVWSARCLEGLVVMEMEMTYERRCCRPFWRFNVCYSFCQLSLKSGKVGWRGRWRGRFLIWFEAME